MKERLANLGLKVLRVWPFRVLASRLLLFKGMKHDLEAISAALAAVKAAQAATDAATEAINAAVEATVALNAAKAGSSNTSVAGGSQWGKSENLQSDCPSQSGRAGRKFHGIRTSISARR